MIDPPPEEYEMPLLPNEATELPEHVRGCALRWAALARMMRAFRTQQNDFKVTLARFEKKISRSEKMDHIYRILIVSLLGIMLINQPQSNVPSIDVIGAIVKFLGRIP